MTTPGRGRRGRRAPAPVERLGGPGPDPGDHPGVLVWPPLLYGSAFLAALALHRVWPLRLPAPAVAAGLGAALLGAGTGVGCWGVWTMWAAGTSVSPTRPTTALVTYGPFRLTRNPLYLALTMLYLGLSFVLGTGWGLAALAPVALLMHYGVVRREERHLERKFGERYRQYRSQVPRYW